jgi:hypothetical protein
MFEELIWRRGMAKRGTYPYAVVFGVDGCVPGPLLRKPNRNAIC